MTSKTPIIVTIDFDDEVVLRRRALTEADIRELLTRLKKCGVDGIAWRLTCLGQAHYHSRVLPGPAFDQADLAHWQSWVRQTPTPAGMRPGTCQAILQAGAREEWTGWLRKTLAVMDPPEVAGRVCRELGLALHLWVDLFDGWFPGAYLPVLREHPEWCWTDHTGTKYLRGVPSYACPENVARMERVVDEINRYRPDGLYFCLSTHSLHVVEHPDAIAVGYGFEPAVRRRFVELHGREPGIEPADRPLLNRVRGACMTELFRRMRARLAPGAQLILPMQLHADMVKTSPYMDGPAAMSYFQDYGAWLRDRLAQGLVLGDYEHIFQWTANWRIKGLPDGNTRTIPVEHLEELLPGLDWRQCPHYFFSGWMGGRQGLADRLARMLQAQRRHPLAGGWLHEAVSFAAADAWDVLADYLEAYRRI